MFHRRKSHKGFERYEFKTPPPPDIYTFVTIQDGLSQQLKPTVNEKHNMLSLNFRHRLQKINKNQIKSNKYS